MADAVIDTPLGPIFVATSERGVRELSFIGGRRGAVIDTPVPHDDATEADALLEETLSQLDAYFTGARREFELPLDLAGTPFQRRVWQEIAAIPFGVTASYAEVASAAGRPNAYRAAGTACGANPVAIIIPCHRVVGSDRGLHGFGGGLDTKRWLLAHEGTLDVLRPAQRGLPLAALAR